MNCPINQQTGDGIAVGCCWYHLFDGKTCPCHGDVEFEVNHFNETGETTLEWVMVNRKGGRVMSPVTETKTESRFSRCVMVVLVASLITLVMYGVLVHADRLADARREGNIVCPKCGE